MTTTNMNMNTMTPQELAEIIADNRWMAKEQLDLDDMGKTLWKQYCQLCDNIAKESWNSLNGEYDENILATSLKLLFNFFGCDAKAVPSVQKRFLLACVRNKTYNSDAMKDAKKALRKAKVAFNDATDEKVKETLKVDVDNAQAEVNRLEAMPKQCWKDLAPLLDKTQEHATRECRKLIEDAMADLIKERSLMTAEEKAAEALALKMARKANKQIAQQKKDAETITE